MTRPLGAVVLAVLLAGCGGDLGSPFSAVAITYDAKKDDSALTKVNVGTLTSLRHLEGTAGTVRAGGSVRVSQQALRVGTATVDSLRASFVTAQPARVELSWSVLNDLVYPDDLDSLELLSAYYNLEKARHAVTGWGVGALPARPVVAHAALADDRGLSPLPPGELYYAPLATFYLPAASAGAQQLPLAFNPGAMGHALGHQLVQERVWGGSPVTKPDLLPDTPDAFASRHLARSFTEGLADFAGAAISGDPVWLSHSIQQGAAFRGLDQLPRCGSPDMLDALAVPDEQVPYDPYPLGTVLAGALYEAALAHGSDLVAARAVQALTDLGTKVAAGAGSMTLGVALDVLVTNADDAIKPDLCGLFYNRFAKVGIKSLPSCGSVSVTGHTECQ